MRTPKTEPARPPVAVRNTADSFFSRPSVPVWVNRPAGSLDNQTDTQTGNQTDKETGNQTDKETGNQTSKETGNGPRNESGSSTIVNVVSVLMLLVAVVSFLVAAVVVRGTGPTKSSSAPVVQAPVFSARRLPEVLRAGVARQHLGTSIDTTLADPALTNALNSSCVVIEIGGGIVAARTPERQVLPASTMKTLTAAAVLARIDPAEKFITEVRVKTAPKNGILNGDLWLVGGGDPLLETLEYTNSQQHDPASATSFDRLVADIVASGVSQVSGGVIGDARRYDDERTRATWKKNYVSDGEVGPIGGLMVDDNFSVMNARKTRVAATNAPADAAQLLRAKLELAGVTFGTPSIGADASMPKATEAAPVVLASIASIPVGEVVREMLSWSDNTTAEMLVKELGFRSTGKGSWSDGLAAVQGSLRAQGVDVKGLNMVDGSGLDRANRVTCDVLLSTVRSQRVDGPFFRGLSVMGEYGTLRKRLRGTAAQGAVHAKTGSLNGVSSLTGFAQTVDQTGDGVRAGNSIAESIVAFPSAPELSEFSLPGQVPEAKPARLKRDSAEPNSAVVASEQPALGNTAVPPDAESTAVTNPTTAVTNPATAVNSSTATDTSPSSEPKPDVSAGVAPETTQVGGQ
jgi:serine-type D-Ala-D-Ala carboxypeptidase/endopeptidase (penicillin-binding protein 4)